MNPQERVAFLRLVPVTLKALKSRETHFEPRTLGEHIRKKRLELALTQKRAADRLGVTSFTVLNWERGKTEPPIWYHPAILTYLGYDPFPEPKALAEQLLAKRRSLGWSLRAAADQMGVDEATWAAWERGETILSRRHRKLVGTFLVLAAANRTRR